MKGFVPQDHSESKTMTILYRGQKPPISKLSDSDEHDCGVKRPLSSIAVTVASSRYFRKNKRNRAKKEYFC